MNTKEIEKAAIFSDCRFYRYTLYRRWIVDDDEDRGNVLFICLNPSTSDEIKDDPTIRRCIGFAKDWGFSSVGIGNLFAYRSTDPSGIRNPMNPIGEENDRWLVKMNQCAQFTVAAWGNNGSFRNRASEVCDLIPNMYCFGKNKSGDCCDDEREDKCDCGADVVNEKIDKILGKSD